MRKRLAAVAVLALMLGACGGDDSVDLPEGGVALTERAFEPEVITVLVGDSVTWVNSSREVHTVTLYQESVPDGAAYFASGGAASEGEARANIAGGLIEIDDSFEHTFDVPGRYEYFCIPHESQGMKGTVVVEE